MTDDTVRAGRGTISIVTEPDWSPSTQTFGHNQRPVVGRCHFLPQPRGGVRPAVAPAEVAEGPLDTLTKVVWMLALLADGRPATSCHARIVCRFR